MVIASLNMQQPSLALVTSTTFHHFHRIQKDSEQICFPLNEWESTRISMFTRTRCQIVIFTLRRRILIVLGDELYMNSRRCGYGCRDKKQFLLCLNHVLSLIIIYTFSLKCLSKISFKKQMSFKSFTFELLRSRSVHLELVMLALGSELGFVSGLRLFRVMPGSQERSLILCHLLLF